MNKIITVIGAFEKGKPACNGQTTKVRNYSEELKKHFSESGVIEIDTQVPVIKLFALFFRVIYYCLKSEVVCILPGRKGIRFILPIVIFCKKRKHFLALYPVVGGWLPDLASQKNCICKNLFLFDRIYVETLQMKKDLSLLGLENVEYAPAFSLRERPSSDRWTGLENPIRLCFFSRVNASKGVDTAIEAVQLINSREGARICVLRIYGKVSEEYVEEFNKQIAADSFHAVEYCGVIPSEDSLDGLAANALMLFPTRYPGEGFPGAVIEGLMAGLPIIASDWRYNSEIIQNGYNGYLFDLADGAEGLAKCILEFISDVTAARKMHQNAFDYSKRFSPEKVLESMFSLIDDFFSEKSIE